MTHFLLIYSLEWSFFDWCSISTLLTSMEFIISQPSSTRSTRSNWQMGRVEYANGSTESVEVEVKLGPSLHLDFWFRCVWTGRCPARAVARACCACRTCRWRTRWWERERGREYWLPAFQQKVITSPPTCQILQNSLVLKVGNSKWNPPKNHES